MFVSGSYYAVGGNIGPESLHNVFQNASIENVIVKL